jgi:hypothetical protein
MHPKAHEVSSALRVQQQGFQLSVCRHANYANAVMYEVPGSIGCTERQHTRLPEYSCVLSFVIPARRRDLTMLHAL